MLPVEHPSGERRSPGALVFPALVTRDGWYEFMHTRLSGAPARLSSFEREALFRAAIADAVREGCEPPFDLRSGLTAEIVELYQTFDRLGRSVDAFERTMVDELEPSAEFDRGARRLLRQTRFLATAFRAYERRLGRTGRVDEKGLRQRLLESRDRSILRQVIVTVADQSAAAWGLWPIDFDLLARLPGLLRVDVIASDAQLAAGFHDRLHDLLPGIEDVPRAAVVSRPPTLSVPGGDPPRRFFVHRDREEELCQIARRVKAGAIRQEGRPGVRAVSDRTAVVFQRPLPYVWLAPRVFASAGVPFEMADASSLASEPFAAALDLVLSCVLSGFSRASIVALLRSPHFQFEVDGRVLRPREVACLDRWLRAEEYTVGRARLEALVSAGTTAADDTSADRSTHVEAAHRGARAAAAAVRELEALQGSTRPTLQLDHLLDFVHRHRRLSGPDAPMRGRLQRGRVAVLEMLQGLRDAYARHGEDAVEFSDLAVTVRRRIEDRMFPPDLREGGVQFLDARAAPYGNFDEVWIVGVVQDDWPARAQRSIFYPQSLLARLGWPRETDRRAGARAAFRDLLHLPHHTVSISSFVLENDAIVPPSPLLDDLRELSLTTETAPPVPTARIFPDEAMLEDPIAPRALRESAAAWLALRVGRSSPSEPVFHGSVEPRPYRPCAVSAVERYLLCPFKFFARERLGILEEPEESLAMTPVARGRLVHQVFHEFFATWDREGGGAITPENLEVAERRFSEVAERHLAAVAEPDRTFERARLLGSALAAGFGRRVLCLEAERPGEIVGRLLEHALNGDFVLAGRAGSRRISIRAVADRIDLLADGAFRLIDYKVGRPPDRQRDVQLPVYGACAEQQLEATTGKRWRLLEAGYLALRTSEPFVPLARDMAKLGECLLAGQSRFLQAVAGIEDGVFPPRPSSRTLCSTCSYASVCRRDYVRGG